MDCLFDHPSAPGPTAFSEPEAIAPRPRPAIRRASSPTASRDAPHRLTRPFERGDVPRVAELFVQAFRGGRTVPGPGLRSAIEATYFGSPAYAPEIGSVVHVDARGRVDGFMGVINTTMEMNGRPLRAGVLSTLMAERPDENPAVGLHLFRATLALPLDVIFTDSANRTSLDVARAMRFAVMPTRSLEWTKLLKPVGMGAYALVRRRPRLRALLGPAAGAVDACMPGTALTAVDRREIDGSQDHDISAEGFVARATALLPGSGLRPAWSGAELSWLLAQAALRTRNGPLQMREVTDRTGRTTGLYLLYAEPGNVAFALQVLARPGREGEVVGRMILRARDIGSVAVRGAACPTVIAGLLRQPCVFYRSVMSTVARSSDPEIAAVLRSGHAMLGGLMGDTWTRIYADEFGA